MMGVPEERTEHMAPTGSREITPRDLQVAKWIALGMERDQVAERLGASRPAINRHMAKLMRLTATVNSTAAVAHLMALDLLRPQDVTSLTPAQRRTRAKILAPEMQLPPAGGDLLRRSDVAAWLRSERIPQPDGEAEEHVNWVLDDLARRFQSGQVRLPIPGPRRDPDAPRPPQQPERDT